MLAVVSAPASPASSPPPRRRETGGTAAVDASASSPSPRCLSDLLESKRSVLKSCTPEQFGGRLWQHCNDVRELKLELETVWESRRRFDLLLQEAVAQLRDAETKLEASERHAGEHAMSLAELQRQLEAERHARHIAEKEMSRLEWRCKTLEGDQQRLARADLVAADSGNARAPMVIVDPAVENSAYQRQQRSHVRALERELELSARREANWRRRHDELAERLRHNRDDILDRFGVSHVTLRESRDSLAGTLSPAPTQTAL